MILGLWSLFLVVDLVVDGIVEMRALNRFVIAFSLIGNDIHGAIFAFLIVLLAECIYVCSGELVEEFNGSLVEIALQEFEVNCVVEVVPNFEGDTVVILFAAEVDYVFIDTVGPDADTVSLEFEVESNNRTVNVELSLERTTVDHEVFGVLKNDSHIVGVAVVLSGNGDEYLNVCH